MLSKKTIEMSIAALEHECRTDDITVTDWDEEKKIWGERVSNLERYEPYEKAISELKEELKEKRKMGNKRDNV